MLKTPIGYLKVYKNNLEIDYILRKLPLKPIEICDYEVDYRALIEIDTSLISCGDIIEFKIDTDINCELDGGDCLVEAMFESDELYLAIGGYDINNGENKYDFAYSFSVTDKGIKVEFKDLQYIEDFSVAIAWSTTERYDYYASVWFAADPYI